MFQDILVTGLVNGSAYALLALGFSLIFGVARIVNIAHTAFYMLAAYCLYALLVRVGLGVPLSGVIAVVSVTLLSVACYRLVIEPVRQHEAAVLIATIALALIFQETMLHLFGGSYLGIPSKASRTYSGWRSHGSGCSSSSSPGPCWRRPGSSSTARAWVWRSAPPPTTSRWRI